jgi:ketosteroid isomerase-like protein
MPIALSREMQVVSEAFEAALSKGNVSLLDQVYARNARIMPPGAAAVHGLEDIKSFWKGAVEAFGISGARLRTEEMNVQGSTAYEVGHCELDTESGGSNALVVKYVVVWEKQGDGWRWVVDIWNTSS